MQETDAILTARREMEICNACRYCEGFCAVFPAMEQRREFTSGDLSYLANLCHNCRGCYYACQYAPPHEWGINVPAHFAEVRVQTYAEYAWPKPMASVFEKNGVVVSLMMALGIALVLILSMLTNSETRFFSATDSFYNIIPLWAMQVTAILTFGYALIALWMGARNFWKDAGPREKVKASDMVVAAWDVLTLKNLGGGGHGCNDNNEAFSMKRRWLHHAMFYGFFLCFASTTSAFVEGTILGWSAPYPFISVPVLLGTVGGVLLTIGCVGLFAMKFVDDPLPAGRRMLGADVALLVLLAMAAVSGLVLLAVRWTGAMGFAMAIHLGFILTLFLVLPYSKMVHGVYRTAALLRRAAERHMAVQGAE